MLVWWYHWKYKVLLNYPIIPLTPSPTYVSMWWATDLSTPSSFIPELLIIHQVLTNTSFHKLYVQSPSPYKSAFPSFNSYASLLKHLVQISFTFIKFALALMHHFILKSALKTTKTQISLVVTIQHHTTFLLRCLSLVCDF